MMWSRRVQRVTPVRVPLLAVPSRVAIFVCMAWTYTHGLLGCPREEAWIHQTYTRNLAGLGQPSAGSTSPV
jgi:hypothetical protein